MAVNQNSPTFLSSCAKLKTGQLKMQRYKIVFNKGNGTKYQRQADNAKQKSRELAPKMKAHADRCPLCSQADDNFYGLDALD